MPEALDRCVLSLEKRGVAKSSAFAICTSSLQRAGKLPTARKKEDIEAAYQKFAQRTALPDELVDGVRATWPELTPSDESLLYGLREVKITDRPGVLGLARLHSRRISLQKDHLDRLGAPSLFYGAVLIHEAMHAIKGFGEHEATRAEQRFAGKVFGQSLLSLDRQMMFHSMKAATMGQAQREVDVYRRHRRDDFMFLNSVGYTTRIVRKIIAASARMSKYLQPQDGVNKRTQYVFEFDEADEVIEKAITREITLVLKSMIGDSDEVLKTGNIVVTNVPYFDLESASVTGEVDPEDFELAVRTSHERGLAPDVRGPLGIVPRLRRVGLDVASLSEEDQKRRIDVVREMIPDVAEQGLYREDGEPTDAHLMMVLHGFAPAKKEAEDLDE